MTPAAADPDAIETLRAALAAEREARLAAEPRATGAEARAVGAEAMIAHLKLVIAKLRHDKFGASSERGRKLLDQLELELGELVATAAEDATRAENQVGTRPGAPPRKPSRGPLPAHLPRERVVLPSPAACPCCGGKLSKLGEDVTETLEVIPRSWKVIQTVREPLIAVRSTLPGLRAHHPATCAIPSDRPWACRTEPACHGAGGEVRPAPAAEPAKRELRPRGRGVERLHPGGLGRHRGGGARAAARADPGACPGG
jgi:hypothetical protein